MWDVWSSAGSRGEQWGAFAVPVCGAVACSCVLCCAGVSFQGLLLFRYFPNSNVAVFLSVASVQERTVLSVCACCNKICCSPDCLQRHQAPAACELDPATLVRGWVVPVRCWVCWAKQL